MFGDAQTFIVATLFLIPGVAIAVPVHELAHSYAAIWQGDTTPRRQGYLRWTWQTFYDPYGVAAALLLRVGWGVMAPVNEYRLRGASGRLIWALAGPAANLVVAIPFGILARVLAGSLTDFSYRTFVQPPLSDLFYLVFAIYFFNLAMFAFNLLPIPGLDGWRVIEALFRSMRPRFFFEANTRRREIWGIAVIVVFLGAFIGLNPLGWVMSPFFHPASSLIFGTCAGYPYLTPCLPLGG